MEGIALGDERAVWRGPTGTADQSGSFDATYEGGMGVVADTGAGGSLAYDFDNVDDALSLPISSLPADYPFAISFWAKKAAGDFVIGSLTTNAATSPFIYFGIEHPSGQAVLVTTGTSATLRPLLTIGDDAWAFIVCNFPSISSRTIRVNDSHELTNTDTGPALSAFNSFNFGLLERTTNAFYDGKVDDIHVYDRVLTSSEITELWNGERGYNRGEESFTQQRQLTQKSTLGTF